MYDARIVRRVPFASLVGSALLGCAVVGAGCFGTAGTPVVVYDLPTRTYTLPSGLRVAVEEDDAATVVGLAWVVEVGHGDDPADKPGLAHVVEHLLYTMPLGEGRGTWQQLLDLGAGGVNAETSSDRTTYYAFAGRAGLDEVARVFASRMGAPAAGLDDAQLAKERQVLGEELAILERDGRPAEQALLNTLSARRFVFPIQAARAALGTISADDVRAFLATYYRPERMTLVLSGPIPASWDQTFLAALPPVLAGAEGARRAPVRRPLAVRGPSVAAWPTIATSTEDVVVPRLVLAWPLPPAQGRGLVPYHIMASLVARTIGERARAGVLRAIADASATTISAKDAHVLLLRLTLKPGADPERARSEARQVLEQLVALPISRWLARERRRANLDLQDVRLRDALALENIASRTLGRAALVHDLPGESLADEVRAVIDSSLEGVAGIIENHLAGPPARSLLLVPRVGQSTAIAAGPPPTGDEAAAPDDDEDDGAPDHDAAEVAAVAHGSGTKAAHVSTLANGLTVIALRRPGLPFATALLGFHANPVPGEPRGARAAVPRAVSYNVVRGALDRGILASSRVSEDAYLHSLATFSTGAEAALDLLADEATSQRVTWPTDDGTTWLDLEDARERTPEARLASAFDDALYGAHPYRLPVHVEDIRRTTPGEISAWLERVRRPANGVLVVVGDIDEDAVMREAAALGAWSGDAAPPGPAPMAVVASHPPVVIEDVSPARSFTQIRFGCVLAPVRAPHDAVVGQLFGRVLFRDLFRHLRTERGHTYAPNVHGDHFRGGTHVLSGTFDVDPAAAPAALQLLHAWLDPGGAATLEPRAVEQERWRTARLSGLSGSTNGALAERLFEAWNMGWSVASLDDYPRDLASVTPGELAGDLAACRATAVISVLSPAKGGAAAP
jgi:zinc protease